MRTLLRALPALALLLFAALPAQAQTQAATVEGAVTTGGEPLPGVNVRVEGTTRGAATDADGRYQITDIEPGEQVIIASAIGFKTVRQEVTLEAGAARTLDFSLEEGVVQGQEVVVTGTMRETYVKDSPTSAAARTRRSPSRTSRRRTLRDLIS